MRSKKPVKSKNGITLYDKEAVFIEKIAPLADEIEKLCTMYNIPMFLACCVKSSDEESEYVRRAVFADTLEIVLKKDYIKKFLNITMGFDTIYRSQAYIETNTDDDEDDEDENLITVDDDE